MKVLITGGAGFIGANLVKSLATSMEISEIRVLDDLSSGSMANLESQSVSFIEGTILDEDILRTAVRGVDSIVHLGAIPSVPRSIANPVASHHANTSGTLLVLEAARSAGVDHVVVASSSSVYGANPKLPKHELDWTRPMSPYAVSKQATEGYALAYQFSYGMKTLAFRFFNVYGPMQAADHAYAAVIPKFLDAALKGRPVEIHGDGNQSRDFTYVETVCAVIRKAVIERISSPEAVNLAYGTNTPLLSLLDEIESQIDREVERVHTESRIGDVQQSQADNSRVRELFPEVEPTQLSYGLAETIAWFQNRNKADHS
ncbi:NAD-dependent epimerase/dehydratase family protein [Yaniella halotolerans]|uniref:NAD-dependent epimerase/dehydratase family protein n=1 Tax=Yaniella halotolerans TaxID=225453 RepID=UPI0003B39046|nr:NAD-dependent epimerase/dehydratase family protein [Yaniella halotolerans]